MSGKRQKIQYSLALKPVDPGATSVRGYQGTEPVVAKPASQSPALTEQLMEEVCDRANRLARFSPDFMSLSQLNPVEPPWYATRMSGGVGGVAPRGVPLSRSMRLSGRFGST